MEKSNNKQILKIAICVNGRAHEGGVTTFINNMVDGLKELGHQVDVITVFGKSDHRQVKPGLINKTDKILTNKNFLTLTAYLISKILLTFHIFFNHLVNQYQVILAIDMSAANIAYPIKHISKVCLINLPIGEVSQELVDQNKIKNNTWVHNYFQKEERKALERSDLNICPSIHLNYINSLTSRAARLIYIKTPVNTKHLNPNPDERKKARENLNIPTDTFVIISVSRLAKRKGVRYPIQALKELIKTDNNIMLIYVGRGPEKNWLTNYAKDNQLESYVKFIDTVPHSDIVNYLRLADCFTFCSTTDVGIVESHSHSPLEAIACGTPVVAFDTFNPKEPGSEKVFYNMENCLLIPEKNIELLIDAINKLKTDNKLKNSLIEGGLSLIEKNEQTPILVAKRIVEQIQIHSHSKI